MTTVPASPLILPARHLHSIRERGDREIRCVAGSLWLTVDGCADDVVLDPGESFVAHGGVRVLAYALQNARFTVERVAAQANRPMAADVDAPAPWWRRLTTEWLHASHT